MQTVELKSGFANFITLNKLKYRLADGTEKHLMITNTK